MDRVDLPQTEFVGLDDPLWRYMGIVEFVSLLQREALWFSRIDELGDPLEGCLPTPVVQSMALVKEGQEYPLHEGLTFGMRRLMKAAICWHANERESNAMWRSYGRDNGAVAVVTSRERVSMALAGSDRLFTIGPMTYMDFDQGQIDFPGELADSVFFKRAEFAEESEVRIVTPVDTSALVLGECASPEEQLASAAKQLPLGEYIECNLSVLIAQVRINPNTPVWMCETIKSLVKSKGLDCVPKRSCLLDTPVWNRR